MATRKASDRVSLDSLCNEFNLPTFDRLDDMNLDYYAMCGAQAARDLPDDASDDDRDAARDAAETAARDDLFAQWHGAVTSALESVFTQHELALAPCKVRRKVPRFPHEFKVRPVATWKAAADAIRDTINGVGYFYFATLREFLESGPYTARGATLSHLHWMRDRARVYGDSSALNLYESAMR